MTQEMKLLMALTEALGFEIETTLDYEERKVPAQYKDLLLNTGSHIGVKRMLVYNEGHGNGLYIDDDGMYASRLTTPIVDYKIKPKFGVYDKGEIK